MEEYDNSRESILIECDINDAIGCIARGYGIYEDKVDIDVELIE
jgi:hypothetical protein